MGGTICWKGNVNPLTELENENAKLQGEVKELTAKWKDMEGLVILAVHKLIETIDGGCPPCRGEKDLCTADETCYHCWSNYLRREYHEATAVPKV